MVNKMDALFYDKSLIEIVSEQLEGAKKYAPEKFIIPEYITSNLKFDLFEWQKSALESFLFYENPVSKLKKTPTHLMFNMATGTGKTLVMAALILYYYKQGYRHFLFFVNANNIVDKTENNFLDKYHTKYLFKDKVVIDNKRVEINAVDVFSDYPSGIEIKFTSIQKLYNDIHIERENQNNLDDFNSKDIIMLADEAHHLNTSTKSKQEKIDLKVEIDGRTSKKDIEKLGWEHTVIEYLLNKNGDKNNRNALLEFTATIPDNNAVHQKYNDKIIYSFGLKQFLGAGYTKQINILSSTSNKKERILTALLFQWYRHRVALDNNIPNFKPVILFRSKVIEESRDDYNYFIDIINGLKGSDLNFINTIKKSIHVSNSNKLFEQAESRLEDILNYITENSYKLSEITQWIKQSYSSKNIIITNSKKNKTKTEKTDEEVEQLLNSLEDNDNYIRAIFTVKRLTEGWDVLNLFDIVRLYQGQNAGGSDKKVPEATVQEKQLIGRGVRYYPFKYEDKLENKRKFDEELDNSLRVLEELYYFTYDEESRYVSHLKQELKKDGYIDDGKIIKTYSLKEEFIKSKFYKDTKVWYNRPVKNPKRRKRTLDDIPRDFFSRYEIKGFELQEEQIELDKQFDLIKTKLDSKNRATSKCVIGNVSRHIFYKAISIVSQAEDSILKFENLKHELEIESINELQTRVLKDFYFEVISDKTQFSSLENRHQLDAVIAFLKAFKNKFTETLYPYIGGEFEYKQFKDFFSKPKIKVVDQNVIDNSKPFSDSLKNEDWYVLDDFDGTNEEIELVKLIQSSTENIDKNFDEYYLLRNEEVFKIFSFKDGTGFQPDFIMFLKTDQNESLNYQIFIEPKGSQFADESGKFSGGKEGWKEKFLSEISSHYGIDGDKVLKVTNERYILYGLPLFNSNLTYNDFKESFDAIIE